MAETFRDRLSAIFPHISWEEDEFDALVDKHGIKVRDIPLEDGRAQIVHGPVFIRGPLKALPVLTEVACTERIGEIMDEIAKLEDQAEAWYLVRDLYSETAIKKAKVLADATAAFACGEEETSIVARLVDGMNRAENDIRQARERRKLPDSKVIG